MTELLTASAPRPAHCTSTSTSLVLGVQLPYDAAGLLAFLLPRAVPGVESVYGVDPAQAQVARSVALEHGGQRYTGWLRVSFAQLGAGQIEVELAASLQPALASLLPLLRAWLDLDASPPALTQALGSAAAGLRLPGCVDRFELAVRAVLGQQVTVAAARTLAHRFVQRFGEPLEGGPEGVDRLFPSAQRMSEAGVAQIAELGIIRRRADCILALARQWPALAYAQRQGPVDAALAQLQSLPGIGPWTAHYMLMRGWSWPDAFPPGDVILRQQLSHGAQALLNPRAYAQAGQAFTPYRSYAVLMLWRKAAQRS